MDRRLLVTGGAGFIGSAYVRGLESAGIVSTLKHFVGYSASRAGRNLAPVSIGPREVADVLLPPFEMALRAGARSVMNSYTDLDGVPVAADPALLTELLRGTYGFTGTVVAPSAELKVFLTASPHERARRRAAERGEDLQAVLAEQAIRDERDSNRAHSPLVAADDAVEIDTTGLSIGEVVTNIADLVATRAS